MRSRLLLCDTVMIRSARFTQTPARGVGVKGRSSGLELRVGVPLDPEALVVASRARFDAVLLAAAIDAQPSMIYASPRAQPAPVRCHQAEPASTARQRAGKTPTAADTSQQGRARTTRLVSMRCFQNSTDDSRVGRICNYQRARTTSSLLRQTTIRPQATWACGSAAMLVRSPVCRPVLSRGNV